MRPHETEVEDLSEFAFRHLAFLNRISLHSSNSPAAFLPNALARSFGSRPKIVQELCQEHGGQTVSASTKSPKQWCWFGGSEMQIEGFHSFCFDGEYFLFCSDRVRPAINHRANRSTTISLFNSYISLLQSFRFVGAEEMVTCVRRLRLDTRNYE